MNNRIEVCEKHLEKRAIFELEQILIENDVPYFFNFWDDLRPTPFGRESDPESIDWDTYIFRIEIGEPVADGIANLSVVFNKDGDKTLLELAVAHPEEGQQDAREPRCDVFKNLDAQMAGEMIKQLYQAN